VAQNTGPDKPKPDAQPKASAEAQTQPKIVAKPTGSIQLSAHGNQDKT
jgi:hypothetical protein